MGTAAAIIGAQAIGTIGSSAFNAYQASKNRKFQREMSNTAHQREMADLKKAGLNPLLTGKYGGASTPGGAQATMSDPNLGGVVASAKQLKQLKPVQRAQINQLNSGTSLNNANSAKAVAETENIRATTANIQTQEQRTSLLTPKEINKLIADTNLSKAQAQKARQEVKKLIQDTRISKTKANTAGLIESIQPKPSDVKTAIKEYLKHLKIEYDKGDIPTLWKDYKRKKQGQKNLQKILKRKRREKTLNQSRKQKH